MSETNGGAQAPAAPISAPELAPVNGSEERVETVFDRRREGNRPPGRAAESKAPTSPSPSEGQKAADKIVEQNANVEQVGKDLYEVKIDGQKKMVTRQELIDAYQVRSASDKRTREAAETKKQAEQIIRLLKENPIEVLKHPGLGHDVRKLMEDYLYRQIELENMDPKERDNMEMREKLKHYEDEKKKHLETEEQKQKDALRDQYTQNYHKDIIETLQSSGLPKSPETVKRMAYYMHEALKRGYRVNAGQVVELVKEDYSNSLKNLYGQLDGESLVSALGEDISTKIRKHDMKKMKENFNTKTPAQLPPKDRGSNTLRNMLSKDEWKARNQRIKDGLE